MTRTDELIAGLNATIEELRSYRVMVIRGYEQAAEELGRQGDYEGKDWSEPYQYLKSRLEQFKSAT